MFFKNEYIIEVIRWEKQAKDCQDEPKREGYVCRGATPSLVERDLLIPFVHPRFTADQFFPSRGRDLPISVARHLTQLVTRDNLWMARAYARNIRFAILASTARLQ